MNIYNIYNKYVFVKKGSFPLYLRKLIGKLKNDLFKLLIRRNFPSKSSLPENSCSTLSIPKKNVCKHKKKTNHYKSIHSKPENRKLKSKNKL